MVKMPGTPVSVCSYQGRVYVGSSAGLNVVAEHKLLSEKFILSSFNLFHGYAYGVAAHKDRLYVLTRNDASTSLVTVYTLAKTQVFQWTHNGCGSNLVIVGDQIVVADTRNKILAVYSLTGEAIKQLHVPISHNPSVFTNVSICAVDNRSVVVSDYKTAKVSKVNISSGKFEWTSEHVRNPQGVAYHRGRVLVADRGLTMRISVLDVETGNTNR